MRGPAKTSGPAVVSQPFRTTPLFDWNMNSDSPVVINQGGMWSGKTVGILQVLFLRALAEPGSVITVTGQDLPNIKGGALRSFNIYIKGDPFTAEWVREALSDFRIQDSTFHLPGGSIIEFKAFETEQDAQSGKRNYLFINEANGVPFAIADALIMRTDRQTFIDYNPTAEFWAHSEYIHNPARTQGKDFDLFISDYRHNLYVPEEIKIRIEARKDDPSWFSVFGRGKTGKIEGLVFPNALPIDWPEAPERVYYGMDFGFTYDPTALVRACYVDGMLIFDEICYERGLTNPDIAARVRAEKLEGVIWYADSADPKSIQELCNLGLYVLPAPKGADSIRFGCDFIKQQPYAITRRSVNMWKEQKSYSHKKDRKTNKYLNEPVDAFNHCWDASRYALSEKMQIGVRTMSEGIDYL